MAENKDISYTVKLITKDVTNAKGVVKRTFTEIRTEIQKTKNASKGRYGKSFLGDLFTFEGVKKSGEIVLDVFKKMAEAALDFEKGMLDLRRITGASTADMEKLKAATLEAGTNAGVSTDDINAMSKGFLTQTKDMPALITNLKLLANAYGLTGGNAESLGEFAGVANRELGLTGAGLNKFMSTLIAGSRLKGTEMSWEQMLPKAGEVIERAKLAYGKGATAGKISEFLIMSMFTGSPEAITMAVKKMFNPAVATKLKRLGINVPLFNKDKTERNFLDIVQDIATAAEKKGISPMMAFETAFGKGSIVAQKLAANMKEVKEGLKSVREAGTLDIISANQAQKSESFAQTMASLQTQFTKISELAAGPMFRQLAEDMKKLKPEDIEKIAKAFGMLGQTLGVAAKAAGILAGWYVDIIEGYAATAAGITTPVVPYMPTYNPSPAGTPAPGYPGSPTPTGGAQGAAMGMAPSFNVNTTVLIDSSQIPVRSTSTSIRSSNPANASPTQH
jgi:hypothetical protein